MFLLKSSLDERHYIGYQIYTHTFDEKLYIIIDYLKASAGGKQDIVKLLSETHNLPLDEPDEVGQIHLNL